MTTSAVLVRSAVAPSSCTALIAHLGPGVFAKDPRTQQALKKQFIRRDPERVYWRSSTAPRPGAWHLARHLVWDRKARPEEDASKGSRGRRSRLRLSVIEGVRTSTSSRFACRPANEPDSYTGGLRGHTLVGERRYVFGPDALRPIDSPPGAHAQLLAFRHPVDGRRCDSRRHSRSRALTPACDPPGNSS
jgi:23S rRNA-/tRNA-specific pseudouridylate synthase